MNIVSPDFVKQKKVLLRFDIDVPIKNGKVVEDFRLKAGLPTLKLCLENAAQVILMGHVGRPVREDPQFSVAPIYEWLITQGFQEVLESKKLRLLENLRFEKGEDEANLDYAKELAVLGDSPPASRQGGYGEAGVFVNESFAAYHTAASTTILPTLLPHAAGLRFAEEVRVLHELRDNPKHPFVAIMGGAKVDDKLPVIKVLAILADAVVVGGKLPHEIKDQNINLPDNVLVGTLNEERTDITKETRESWRKMIEEANMIVWNGPLGKFEDPQNNETQKIAELILNSKAKVIIGGGETISALSEYQLLDRFLSQPDKFFASTGGGAMLEYICKGALPTIEALD